MNALASQWDVWDWSLPDWSGWLRLVRCCRRCCGRMRSRPSRSPPTLIKPPDGLVVLAKFKAAGVQIYECKVVDAKARPVQYVQELESSCR